MREELIAKKERIELYSIKTTTVSTSSSNAAVVQRWLPLSIEDCMLAAAPQQCRGVRAFVVCLAIRFPGSQVNKQAFNFIQT
jgi:hypothetical protein